MKSPQDALTVGVEAILDALERGQYSLAARASGNLTRLAYSLESVDDVFIGEVMSAVCGHVDYVLRSYHVDGGDMNNIHESIVATMGILVTAYKERTDGVGTALQNLRYLATSLAIDAEQRYPLRNPPEQGGQA